MAKEKKRVQPKPLPKAEPRKRPPKSTKLVKADIQPEDAKTPTKKSDDKFLKVKETESRERFKQIGDQISRGELQWSYYGIEGDIGIHYYIIKKTLTH